MFRVVNLRNKKSWPNSDDEEMVFRDGDKAKEAALELNKGVEFPYRVYVPTAEKGGWHTGRYPLQLEAWFGSKDVYVNPRDKWQVRKIVADQNWRQEQHARFTSGKYKPVPWADQPEWQEWIKEAPQCDHFVHIAVEDSECIAYTKTPEAGEMDIQTRTTPAKYFNKFIKDDSKDSKYYKKVALEWVAIWTKIQTATELKFAYTREEIREVYENGPPSCMCGDTSRFFKHKIAPHPVEAYAAGDLAVAYLKRKSGKISARVLCWPAKLVYNRLYGEDATLLQSLLKTQGYSEGYLAGAKLCLINVSKFTKVANTFLIPSINTYPNVVTFIEETKEFRICHDPILPEERKYMGSGSAAGFTPIQIPYVSEYSGEKFDAKIMPPVLVFVTKTKVQVWTSVELREHGYYCFTNKRYYSKEKCAPTLVRMEGGVHIYKSPYEYKKREKKLADWYDPIPANWWWM